MKILDTPTARTTASVCTALATSALLLTSTSCSDSGNGTNALPKKEQTRSQVDTVGPLTILGYGLPDFERENARNVVSKRWGIRFRDVAGCTPSSEQMEQARTNNTIVLPLIEARFGNDWRERFKKEVEEEFEIEKKVLAVLERQRVLRRKDRELGKEGNALMYSMVPISGTSRYDVVADGWGTVDGEDAIVAYFNLKVDYKTGRIDSLQVHQPPVVLKRLSDLRQE